MKSSMSSASGCFSVVPVRICILTPFSVRYLLRYSYPNLVSLSSVVIAMSVIFLSLARSSIFWSPLRFSLRPLAESFIVYSGMPYFSSS